MREITIRTPDNQDAIRASFLCPGEIGVEPNNGHVLMGMFAGETVDLNDPNKTWAINQCPLYVRKLPPGTILTLIV